MRLVRAVLAAALASPSACSLDSSGKSACHSSADCLGSDVCHLGRCRDPGDFGGAGDSPSAGASSTGGAPRDGGGHTGGTPSGGGRASGSGGNGGLSDGGSGGNGGLGDAGSGAGGEPGGDAAPPGCGDGTLDGEEACDDGNSNASDGCSRACTVEPGNGCVTIHGPSSRCFACAAPLHVDARSKAVTPLGATWADAYPALGPAIVEAETRVGAGCSPVEIWVAAGRYTPTATTTNRAASFRLRAGVALYGGFAGTESSRSSRDWLGHRSVLTGDLAGDDGTDVAAISENSAHVVEALAADASSVLDGFVITGGNGDGATSWGAGLLHQSGTGRYENVLVYRNVSSYVGGGMMILGGAPALVNAWFVDNHASQGGAALSAFGSPEVDGLFALGNTGSVAIQTAGGGNSRLERLVLAGNEGGALTFGGGDFGVLNDVVVAGNTAESMPGLFLATSVDARHVTVTGNQGGSPVSAAVTFSLIASGARVDNGILSGNTPLDVNDGGEDSVWNSLLPDAAGNGNVDLPPAFASVSGLTGTWTARPLFDVATTVTVLVDASADFPPDLAGSFVQPRAEGTAEPRWALIAASTAHTLSVWGDVTAWTGASKPYAVRRLTLDASSPAIDAADAAHSTALDVTGKARHDVPDRGTGVADLGAYEWRPEG